MRNQHPNCPFRGSDEPRVNEIPVGDEYKFVVRCDFCGVQTTPRTNHVVVWEDWDRRPETAASHVCDFRPAFDGTMVCKCGGWK